MIEFISNNNMLQNNCKECKKKVNIKGSIASVLIIILFGNLFVFFL